ncbi:unnamed protein product [Rotaria socialis]|uniref:Nuclear transport factor 2 family protein n=1 Tax=Rotaria socialis TaxID=392032 RepID=A0A820AH53_9BILA|nr:unnamed protein product [Rotaria socialis]CAF4193192.1 unnamed protein product [Rotaria socialis]
MSNSLHKTIIEQFAEAVSGHQINQLDSFLEVDVQKTTNSKIIYKNIQEAQDYYGKENSTQWKILEFIQDDPNGNTMQTRISHGDKTYKTSYTFSSAGKIHRIDTIIEQ